MTRVDLADAEFKTCKHYADLRGKMHDDTGGRHLKGIVGEFALAKHLGCASLVHWFVNVAYQSEDVYQSIPHDVVKPETGQGYQVRTCRPGNRLTLYKKDEEVNQDAVFVLVYRHENKDGVTTRCTLAGWCYGRDAMTPDAKSEARRIGFDDAIYAVPADDLNPMETMP
jgi:hypothetical protein